MMGRCILDNKFLGYEAMSWVEEKATRIWCFSSCILKKLLMG
jgi:hypothetical protein